MFGYSWCSEFCVKAVDAGVHAAPEIKRFSALLCGLAHGVANEQNGGPAAGTGRFGSELPAKPIDATPISSTMKHPAGQHLSSGLADGPGVRVWLEKQLLKQVSEGLFIAGYALAQPCRLVEIHQKRKVTTRLDGHAFPFSAVELLSACGWPGEHRILVPIQRGLSGVPEHN